jgi:hypothetical protein
MRFGAAASVLLLSAGVVLGQARPDYHIGNSLTVDAELPGNVAGVDQILASRGAARPAPGWTIMSGSGLHRHFTFTDNSNNPVTPNPGGAFGLWNNAFANNAFANVTLQPWSSGTTAFQERDAFIGLVNALRANPANRTTQIWLYPGFPQTPAALPVPNSAPTFEEVWAAPLPNMTASTAWPRTRAGTLWMEQQVESAIPGVDVRVVPVGEVLSRLDAALRANPITRPHPSGTGTVTYDSVWDLYRDTIHLGPVPANPAQSEGIYALAVTLAATLYNIDPRLIEPTSRFTTARVDPAFATLAERIVWSTQPTVIPQPGGSVPFLLAAATLTRRRRR